MFISVTSHRSQMRRATCFWDLSNPNEGDDDIKFPDDEQNNFARAGAAHHVDDEGGCCEGDGDVGVAAERSHASHGAEGGRGIVPGLQVGPALGRLLAALHPHRQPPPVRLRARHQEHVPVGTRVTSSLITPPYIRDSISLLIRSGSLPHHSQRQQI